jgi:hypothetical protein
MTYKNINLLLFFFKKATCKNTEKIKIKTAGKTPGWFHDFCFLIFCSRPPAHTCQNVQRERARTSERASARARETERGGRERGREGGRHLKLAAQLPERSLRNSEVIGGLRSGRSKNVDNTAFSHHDELGANRKGVRSVQLLLHVDAQAFFQLWLLEFVRSVQLLLHVDAQLFFQICTCV